MDALLDQLDDEANNLIGKIDRLETFILTEAYYYISDIQKSLLVVQLSAMKTYLNCLSERINNLT